MSRLVVIQIWFSLSLVCFYAMSFVGILDTSFNCKNLKIILLIDYSKILIICYFRAFLELISAEARRSTLFWMMGKTEK